MTSFVHYITTTGTITITTTATGCRAAVATAISTLITSFHLKAEMTFE